LNARALDLTVRWGFERESLGFDCEKGREGVCTSEIGGRKGRAFYGDVLALNSKTGVAWEQVLGATAGFPPRAGHTATLVGKEIWVIGGSNNETIFGDVSVFDVVNRSWRFPSPR
jgi:hypothetical protein